MKRNHCQHTPLQERTMTPHRREVLAILKSARQALTPNDILKIIRQGHAFDKVTLYRTLDFFVEQEILRRIAAQSGAVCYEIACSECSPDHAHFICRDCGGIECLEDIHVSALKLQLPGRRNFKRGAVDLKIEGICLSCENLHDNKRKGSYAKKTKN